MWTEDLRICVPSLNILMRMHYYQIGKLKDEAFMVIGAMFKHVPKAQPGQRRKVTIVRHGTRLLDIDNLYGSSAKILLDALKNHKIISNDDPGSLELVCSQQKVAKGVKPYTTVMVEDL